MITDTSTSPAEGRPSASGAADEIRSAAQDAGQTARSALRDTGAAIHDHSAGKVDGVTTSAGDSLDQVAAQLRQAGRNLGQEQEWARQAFEQGAAGMERVSGYLRHGQLDDFTRDIQSFARRNPAAFLAGSVAVGFLVARVARTAAEHAGLTGTAGQEAASSADRPTEAPGAFAPGAQDLGYTARGEIR